MQIGINTNVNDLGDEERNCAKCNQDTMHSMKEKTTRLLFFGMPVFTFGGGAKHILKCSICGTKITEAAD
jgi:hypothetical protein